ncbi:antitoxin [Sphingomonas sp. IBVSS1]|nr:antitoxin [Sphingomonas sp. IBVSS1]
MSRLTIDITERQHQSLKALAALEGKTIKQYALERLFPAPVTGDADWQALRILIADRVQEGLDGKLSTTSIPAIVDEEMGKAERA